MNVGIYKIKVSSEMLQNLPFYFNSRRYLFVTVHNAWQSEA